MKLVILPAALLALAGCAAPAASGGGACPILSSSGWRAWVDAMPGGDRPRLWVLGQVTVPTGGYRLSLRRGAIQEIDPPVQEVILVVEPPTGGATQAVVTHDVRQDFDAEPRYGAVVVRCGKDILADIRPVPRAD